MIKEEYINPEQLDDNSLLMQYFRKHDADSNNLLDGLELLKALAKMDCKCSVHAVHVHKRVLCVSVVVLMLDGDRR